MSDDKNTVRETRSNITNHTPETSKTSEIQATVETACTKNVTVVLHRLPEDTVNRILSRQSPCSASRKKTSTRILTKCLLSKLESRLTQWIKKKSERNGDHILSRKVMRKAKLIFERLKANESEKYKNVSFVPNRKWYNHYRGRAGWYVRQSLENPSIHQDSHCNVVNATRNKLLASIPTNSDDEMECTRTKIGEDNDDWCSRLKSDLIHEKARDLMIDTVTSYPLLNCTKNQQKSPIKRCQEELDEQREEILKCCVTPILNIEAGIELDSSWDSASDLTQFKELIFGSKAVSSKVDITNGCVDNLDSNAVSSKVDITNECVDNIKPVVITIVDEEMPHTSTSLTRSVDTLVTNECTSSENRFLSNESISSQVPFFKSVGSKNEAVQQFRQKFERIIKQEKYIPQQILCAQETTLYWKHMPTNCGVLDSVIGELPESKDPMMLLLCTNASGDCRFEPMLVYSKDDPPSIRHLIKSSLPVIWKFHPRAKITNSLFEDWFTYSFVPTVQVYCIEHRIPFQALLVLDTASSHNPVIEFAHPNVKVVFLSPDIAQYVQPMELGITTTFKVNYLKRLFEMIADYIELENGENTQSFWNNFDVFSALKLIKTAWLDVSQLVVTLAWRIMCLGSLPKDSEEGNAFSDAVALTISVAEHTGVQLSERDISNWLYYQSHELTNDELKALEQRSSVETGSSGAEVPLASLTTSKLLEAFKSLRTAMKIFESEDPNYKRSSYVNEEIRRSYKCYQDMYCALKKTDGVENASNDDVSDGIKVEVDKSPLTTDLKTSPSMLVKWFSNSSVDSAQSSRFQLTLKDSSEQNLL